MQGSDYWREDVLGLSEFCYAYQNLYNVHSFFYIFLSLAGPSSMSDLSSLTRDQTWLPCIGNTVLINREVSVLAFSVCKELFRNHRLERKFISIPYKGKSQKQPAYVTSIKRLVTCATTVQMPSVIQWNQGKGGCFRKEKDGTLDSKIRVQTGLP